MKKNCALCNGQAKGQKLIKIMHECWKKFSRIIQLLTRIFFLNNFYGETCPIWLSLLSFVIFLPSSGPSVCLVFRCSRDSNPRPRTMAWIVSPRRSPQNRGLPNSWHTWVHMVSFSADPEKPKKLGFFLIQLLLIKFLVISNIPQCLLFHQSGCRDLQLYWALPVS